MVDEVERMTGAEKNRVDTGRRKAEMLATIRNIGSIPVIENIERRESCRNDLAQFIMVYGGDGKDPFSDDHIRVIQRIEQCVLSGGRFVEAVYRGFGKTTISRFAVVWAMCYGHRLYVPIVGANSSRASENMDAIKGIYESPLIVADFPEIAYPISRLEGITQRAHGQLYTDRNGNPQEVGMKWGADRIVLPNTDGAFDANGDWHDNVSRGGIILACGITSSALRGMNTRRDDGIELRPDFCVIDDPQDEESATSPDQVNKRLNIIRKAILKSAGHKDGMAVVMPCTVIQKDDLVDQLLDPKRNPSWQAERIPFVISWSSAHDTLWMNDYRSIRTTYKTSDPSDYLRARRDATAFYEQNRAAMDDGCVVSWQSCFAESEDEISAIQHAYNALIDDGEDVFASEFQNQPFIAPEEEGQLTKEHIAAMIRPGMGRYEIPATCDKLTAFVDVQGKCLYYVVCAFQPDFTGYIIDYGVFPDQNRHYFVLRQVDKTLMDMFPGTGQEAAWRKGFEAISQIIVDKEYRRDDGAVMKISRLLIDSNDGSASQTVFDFCRESKYGAVVMPSKGKGVTASGKPFSEYHKAPGDRVSDYNWRQPSPAGRGQVRHILYDTNWWKSFTRARIKTNAGDSGCLSLFGKPPANAMTNLTMTHEMFTDQMVSEYSIRTEGRGRTVDEWAIRPNLSDNHWWDCLVGCMVAASEQGCALNIGEGKRKTQRQVVDLSNIQRRKLN